MHPLMKTMVLEEQAVIEQKPLALKLLPRPSPGPEEVLIRVSCCAICRTDLHIIEGDLPLKKMAIIPGHQAIGTIEALGTHVTGLRFGQKVGAAWLGYTCGNCPYCAVGKENLCVSPKFTGYDFDGGYAEYMVAHQSFIYPLVENTNDILTAPLLCAGIIGYRALKRSNFKPGDHLGIFGFGSSAHITAQIVLHEKGKISVVTRGEEHQKHARDMGAFWSSGSTEGIPEETDAAILFAPAGELVPNALSTLKRGGTLAIAGIHLSDIPTLNYEKHLFYEKDLRSVTANTREDGKELLKKHSEMNLQPEVTVYSLEDANKALLDLKNDKIKGTGVLQITSQHS
ncbi:MAG: zinc-dependent alcohol dehydrogenase family protein [Bdellovibrionales bacterium]|nr:zinc-dependent alcohol dehydrogenase family protein [Bdellovibrionales bacterium]